MARPLTGRKYDSKFKIPDSRTSKENDSRLKRLRSATQFANSSAARRWLKRTCARARRPCHKTLGRLEEVAN